MIIPTRPLFALSAAFMISLGAVASFSPETIAAGTGISAGSPVEFLIRVMGALYVGFGMLNWANRAAPAGGIYSRPLVMGNLLHFMMGAFALWRLIGNAEMGNEIRVVSVLYVVFALAFSKVLVTNPFKTRPLDKSAT